MANLDGSRSHGGKWDILAGAMLCEKPAHFTKYQPRLRAMFTYSEPFDRT
jgi:hypothetical protein